MNLTPNVTARCDRHTEEVQRLIGTLTPKQQDELWACIHGVLRSGMAGHDVHIKAGAAHIIADIALAGLYLLIMREQERIDQEKQGDPT